MICAYDKVYLEKARVSLGRMLDFAVYDLQYDISDFFHLFLSSGIAERFGKGAYITKATAQMMRDLGSIQSPQNAFHQHYPQNNKYQVLTTVP